MTTKAQENYVDHEVRLRRLQEILEDSKQTRKQLKGYFVTILIAVITGIAIPLYLH